jgi:hypothetical protein
MAFWNAPLDDPDTNERLDRFMRMQASVFNGVAEIWVPRYRQATFGAFLKPGPDADRALALALGDLLVKLLGEQLVLRLESSVVLGVHISAILVDATEHLVFWITFQSSTFD